MHVILLPIWCLFPVICYLFAAFSCFCFYTVKKLIFYIYFICCAYMAFIFMHVILILISCLFPALLFICYLFAALLCICFLLWKWIRVIIISSRFSADMPLIFRHVILVLICCLFSALFYICSLFATSFLFSMFLFFIVKDIKFYYFLQIFCLYAIAHKY